VLETDAAEFEALDAMESTLAMVGTSVSEISDAIIELKRPAPSGSDQDEEAGDLAQYTIIVQSATSASGALANVAATAASRGGVSGKAQVRPLTKAARVSITSRLLAVVTVLDRRAKQGARHSEADRQLLQGAHDQLVALGAVCTPAPAPVDKPDPKQLLLDGKPLIDDEVDLGGLTPEMVRAAVVDAVTERLMAVTGRLAD
jgi:hypothetical protein